MSLIHVRFFASFAVVLVIMVLAKLTFLMNVGIDFTDEGYYLNWISNPWLYQYYVSQFGYIYHPIYQLLDSDLVKLRIFNALLTYGLGLILSYLIINRLSKNQSKSYLFAISASVALSTLLILMITGHWVPTPSYNSLCFQGLLITVLGIVCSDAQLKHSQFLAALLIGLGGWLVFMAKPSSALLLGILVPLYFVFEIKKYWRLLLCAGLIAICFLLLTAWYIDGHVLQFIKRYQEGLILMDSMASKHGIENLLRLDFFKVAEADQKAFLILTTLLTGVFLSLKKDSNVIRNMALLLLLTILASILWHAFNIQDIKINTPRYHPLILLSPLLATALYWLFSKKANPASTLPSKLIVLLLLMPYLYVAGTGNNYWETAAGAILFWILASLLLLGRSTPNQMQTIAFALIVASISVKVILDAQNSPYRQTEAIAKQISIYTNPHTNKELILPKDTATYLNDLSRLLHKTNFKKNTPVIDFTGHHPGTLYFMQAKAIGQAWMIGGYDGSNKLAALALSQASCREVASAWLMIEKDGHRRIDSSILEQHGIKADKNHYTKVGMIKSKQLTDFGFVNQSHPDGRYDQYFLMPNYPETQEKSCLNFREKTLPPN
jgi:hypothetical protein